MTAPQPFYLLNAFWGERFRRYFCEAWLPSVLSPGNLSGLDPSARNAILIATTDQDWKAITDHPALRRAAQYFNLRHVSIPEEKGRHKFNRVAAAYGAMSEIAYRERARAFFMCPDHLLSDGSLRYLQGRLDAGAGIVFVSSWRSDEEKLFAALRDSGIAIFDRGDTAGEALCLQSRDLVAACRKSLHLMEQDRIWDSPVFSRIPGIIFWPTPSGFVAHAFSGMPVIDFSRVTRHEIAALAEINFDAYPTMIEVAGHPVEMVDDTDKAMIASWTPAAESDDWQHFRKRPLLRLPGCHDLARAAVLRAYARHVFCLARNRLNQVVFMTPIWIHDRDLTPECKSIGRRAQDLLMRAAGDMVPPVVGARVPVPGPGHRLVMKLAVLIFAFSTIMAQNLEYLRVYSRIGWSALCGDRRTWQKIGRKLGLGSGAVS